MQKALSELREKQETVLNDLLGVGLVNNSEIDPAIAAIRQKLETLRGTHEENNPFLHGALRQLGELRDGTADLSAVASALNYVRAAGAEAHRVYDQFRAAVTDSDLEAARQALIEYANAAGVFQAELDAIATAEGPQEAVQAFENLANQIFDAGVASELFGGSVIASVGEVVENAALAQLQIQYMEAALEGNTEEADRLRAMLAEATGQAEALAGTSISPPITQGANEAARLAENLAAARAQQLDRITGGNPDFFDPRNETGNSGVIFRPRPVPVRNRPGYEPPSTRSRSGGTSGGGASAAERDLAAARELLIENGQKALYIEQGLNAERERLRKLLPSLIRMGLSRADAEAVINSELERTEERLKRVKSASEEAAESFARGILSDIRSADSLSDAIGRIADRLIDLALDPVFDQLASQFASLFSGGGSSGGCFLGSLFSGIFGGFREDGGPVQAGKAYVVGEKRPELFVPRQSGTIVPEVPTVPKVPPVSAQAAMQTLQIELVGGPLLVTDGGQVMAEVDVRLASGVTAGLKQNNKMVMQHQRRG